MKFGCHGARSRARDLGDFNAICTLLDVYLSPFLKTVSLSPLYEPQLLTSEFAVGVPKIQTRKLKPLAPIQRRYIYWGRANGLTFQEIADTLGCGRNTVWRRIQALRLKPLELLDSGFVQPNRTRNGDKAYFCRFCGYGALTDTTVVIHAYEHLFGEGSLRPSPSPARDA